MKKGQRRKDNHAKAAKQLKNRKNAKRKRPNPASGLVSHADILLPGRKGNMPDLLDAFSGVVGNILITSEVTKCTLQEKTIIAAMIKNVLIPILRSASPDHKSKLAAKMDGATCVCKGECLCHTGVQLAGVPCPADCPNYGKYLDGCHRCDCTPVVPIAEENPQ